jgi:hypothetical protein
MEEKRELLIRQSQQERPQKGKSYFLGIGIDQYQHFQPLNNAVKDARDLAALLQEKYDLDEVFLITDEAATRDSIIRQLDELKQKVGPQDKLLIFYSGHGHLDSSQKGYWIPSDAEPDNTAHYIRNSTLRDYIEDIPSLHTLLISDACFSGSLFYRGPTRSSKATEELEKQKSRWALCSGRHDEEVFDGPPGTNSPFTGSVLKVLRNNQAPKLKVSTLTDEVTELTRANYRQMPEGFPLLEVGHDGGQYVFRLKANEAEDWASCQLAATAGAYRQFLHHYPEGKFAEEALWQFARLQHSLPAYDDYLARYPQGRYSDEAQRESLRLQEEADWLVARGNADLPSLRKYLRKYPRGAHVTEAEDLVQRLREQGVGTPPQPPEPLEPRQQQPVVAPPPARSSRLPWLIAGLAVLILLVVVWRVIQRTETGPMAQIEFEETHHDFGEIPLGEPVSWVFTFENHGPIPLEVFSVESDPLTTIAGYPREPIPPGGRGEIHVVFAIPEEWGGPDGGDIAVQAEALLHSNAEFSPLPLSVSAFVRGREDGQEGQQGLDAQPERQYNAISPGEKQPGELGLIMEEIFFQEVKDKNTLESYQGYLDRFPEGRFREQAREAIRALRDGG